MAYVFQTFGKDGKPHPLWRFQYRDHRGRKVMRTGTTSRRETEKMADQLQAMQRAILNGVIAAPKASDKAHAIDDLIERYLEWGRAQGGRRGRPWASEHARKRQQDLAFWKGVLKLKFQVDLMDCQSKVERVIHRLQVVQGRSGKTVWNRVDSLMSFARWCMDRDYLEQDPFRRLKKINTEPVRRRRPLTPEEIPQLLEACLPERRLLYETALCTGLRANELRHVTPETLDTQRCGIHLRAEWTKNRKDTFQPVPDWLMVKLEAVAQTLGMEDPIFGVQKTHPARMIRTDLERAGIPLDMPGQGRVDFHSLRMTYCTLLDFSGASAKETQELARHSTPTLTMDRYVRTRTDRVQRVVEAVGEIVNPQPLPEQRPNEKMTALRVIRNAV